MRMIEREKVGNWTNALLLILCLSLQSFAMRVTGTDRMEVGRTATFNIYTDSSRSQSESLDYKIYVITVLGLKMIQQGEVILNAWSTNVSIVLDSSKLGIVRSSSHFPFVKDHYFDLFSGVFIISRKLSSDIGIKPISILHETLANPCDCQPVVQQVWTNFDPSFRRIPSVRNGDEISAQFMSIYSRDVLKNWEWQVLAFRKDGFVMVDSTFSQVDSMSYKGPIESKMRLDVSKAFGDSTIIKDAGKMTACIFTRSGYTSPYITGVGNIWAGSIVEIEMPTAGLFPSPTKRKSTVNGERWNPIFQGTKSFDLTGRLLPGFVGQN